MLLLLLCLYSLYCIFLKNGCFLHCPISRIIALIGTTKGTFASSQDDEIEFLYGLFEKCPAKRLTARQALQHKYFSNDPPPMPHDQLNLGKDSSGGVGGDDSGGGGDADKGGASDEGAAPGGAGGGGGAMKRKYADDDGDDDGDDSGGGGSKPTKLAF